LSEASFRERLVISVEHSRRLGRQTQFVSGTAGDMENEAIARDRRPLADMLTLSRGNSDDHLLDNEPTEGPHSNWVNAIPDASEPGQGHNRAHENWRG